MTEKILGIHHVTAIASDPQRNLDFYTRDLGLRLVKKTVNFDDPGTYHFYFGDSAGSPGTILTFFPWVGARRGSRGAGQATVTSFAVPTGAVSYWMERLRRLGVVAEEPVQRFGLERIAFLDPDGLKLEIVADPEVDAIDAWQDSTVPAASAIRGFHGVTLSERSLSDTTRFLVETMGFDLEAQEDAASLFRVGNRGLGSRVEVIGRKDLDWGQIAAGTVHHVAWRVASDETEGAWREKLIAQGHRVSAVMDRQYFHSIYFREPGGVLFEIATDPPGFAIDESLAGLGSELRLPPWLEAEREAIESMLPRVSVAQDETSGVAR